MAIGGHMARMLVLGWAVIVPAGSPAFAAGLKSDTIAAFDRYLLATEQQQADDLRDGRFLVIDGRPDAARLRTCAELQKRQINIEQLHTAERARPYPTNG